MVRVDPGLDGDPDRLRWNARYGGSFSASFRPHPVAVEALARVLPPGPVLELASGPSGSALLAAAAGRRVVAVDASEVALGLLWDEAGRREVRELITLVHADLGVWRPEPGRYALVLCTGFWDQDLFPFAADAVMPRGLLGWEAFTVERRRAQPDFPIEWCLMPGQPASLLPDRWQVLHQADVAGPRRRLLAGRQTPGPLSRVTVSLKPQMPCTSGGYVRPNRPVRGWARPTAPGPPPRRSPGAGLSPQREPRRKSGSHHETTKSGSRTRAGVDLRSPSRRLCHIALDSRVIVLD